MHDILNPLENIEFLTIPEKVIFRLSPEIDPEIKLPIERTGKQNSIQPEEITIEALIAGMLRVLIYDPEHEHTDYYRHLVTSLRPQIKQEFTEAGIAKARLEDFPVAIEVFQGLSALFPDCGITHLNTALIYESASRFYENDEKLFEHYTEKAFDSYHAALEHGSSIPDVSLNFGYFLCEHQNFEKGSELLQQYLSMSSDPEKNKKVREHLDSIAGFIEMDTLFKEAYDNISMGKEAEGITKITKVLEKNPEFWNGLFLLGWAHRRLGNFEQAKEAFLKASSLREPPPDLLNELAISHMELGELTESLKCLEQALKLEPENTKVLSNMGIVLLKMNRKKEAEGVFRTILEFDPDDPLAKKYLEDM